MNQEIGAFAEEASPAKKADSPSVGDKRLAEVSPEEMKQALQDGNQVNTYSHTKRPPVPVFSTNLGPKGNDEFQAQLFRGIIKEVQTGNQKDENIQAWTQNWYDKLI